LAAAEAFLIETSSKRLIEIVPCPPRSVVSIPPLVRRPMPKTTVLFRQELPGPSLADDFKQMVEELLEAMATRH
jgi:hypothetical protein